MGTYAQVGDLVAPHQALLPGADGYDQEFPLAILGLHYQVLSDRRIKHELMVWEPRSTADHDIKSVGHYSVALVEDGFAVTV
jgi:hypothetical protein